ncbi:MAG: zinc-dependent metalloprotease [Myxococcales bacterium]|nr:zinc-dependent metalloprotease [Myxococcales bacterium]
MIAHFTGSDPKGLARPTHRHTLRRVVSTLLGAALLASTAGFVSGCAEERDPIDRVQPYALKKANFTGEWYYQRTVVDVPSSNGFTFVGNTDHSGLQKVKFDIQEKTLFVRRNVELIKGGDDKALKGDDYEGEVIAAFPIVKHFDVRRAYNPTTGEEMNIMEENAIDRPWYEREFIRVDWSSNKVTNYQLDFERKSIESVPYYPQQTSKEGALHPDAPHLEFETDAPYFDVTNRIFAKAGTIEYPGYGQIPVCWLMGEETTECGSGEYSIRHSFKKIDPNHQFIARPYKGAETDMFGFFTSDRLVYDSKLGIKQQKKERYLQRHNIWKNWKDADGKVIPPAKRTPRPIVYHVNLQFTDELKPVARKVSAQWNKVFKDAVKATGNPYDGDMFILCENNPVKEGDPKECGEAGTSPRLGDIRYSFMAWVPKYMKYGLLGLGPSNNDPETGEILSGMAYMYHHNNTAAWRTVEMIELLNGIRSPQDFIKGVDLTEWVTTVANKKSRFQPRGLEEANEMVSRIANSVFSKYWAGRRTKLTQLDVDTQHKHGHHHWADKHLQTMYDAGHLNGLGNSAQARLDRVANTGIEKQLMHPELKMAAGFAPEAPVTQKMLDAASPLRSGLKARIRDRDRIRQEIAASRNMYLPEMLDDALMGLAKEVKGKTSDEIYKMVQESVYTAVFAHEVGHSLGLMHNFGGSDDAVNYFDGYWKLRDDGKVAPRLVDPITEKEINGKIYNYAYSSVMDYAGRLTIDGLGVGKYDRAAILFGYANKVEVFKDAGKSKGVWKKWFNGRSEILEFFIFGPQVTHYTKVYNDMGPKMYEASNRQLVDASQLSADLSTAKSGDQTLIRVPYVYCSHGRSDLSDSCLTRDFGADSQERMSHFLDEWDTWYVTRSFVRGNLGVSNWSYANRYYRRIYHRIKQWHDIYGLYAAFLPQFYSPEMLQKFFTDPVAGWGGNTWAVQNAFQFLVETILMPDVGGYAKTTRADGTQLWKSGGGGNLNLGIADARYYSTDWSRGAAGGRECGYFWYECLSRIGFYVDKIMAIMAISDSRTNFVARANPIDIREWHVSYYNTFSKSIRSINAALQSGDWSRVGPYKDSSGKVRFPNYSGKLDAIHADPIDPAADFTVQLYFSLLGQANFMTNYDRDFIEEAQIWVAGTWKAPQLPAESTVSFADPGTGMVYGALKKKDGAGAAMIAHANRLLSRSSQCDGTSATATTADDCFKGLSAAETSAADADLKKYVQLLKSVADMSFAMSYGHPLSP